MNISKRLKTIAGMVRYATLADVGTDHAYLPVRLAVDGRLTRAAACDVNKGPLAVAAENIAKAGFSEVIETRHGSGLDVVAAGEFETLVMAGMGGALITELISGSLQTAKSFKQLILQPQRNLYELRLFLINNGFTVTDEELIIDGGKYYFIIEAQPGLSEPYCEAELAFGKFAAKKNSEAFTRYVFDEMNKLKKIIAKNSATERSRS